MKRNGSSWKFIVLEFISVVFAVILGFMINQWRESYADNQLAKSATSIGANYEEAQSAYSRDDFKYKMGICLRETRESNYWLRIIKASNIINGKDLDFLIQESTELRMIFSSIMKKIHFRKKLK